MIEAIFTFLTLVGVWADETRAVQEPETVPITENVSWLWHADEELGYKVKYPESWILTLRPPLPDLVGDTTFMSRESQSDFSPPNHFGVPRQYEISIGQRSSKVSEDMTLQDWTKLHICHSRISAGDFGDQIQPWKGPLPEGADEIVYVVGDSSQYIHARRGGVIWLVLANYGSNQEFHTQMFYDLVGSLQFEADAPQTYEEIYGHSPGELWFPGEKEEQECLDDYLAAV